MEELCYNPKTSLSNRAASGTPLAFSCPCFLLILFCSSAPSLIKAVFHFRGSLLSGYGPPSRFAGKAEGSLKTENNDGYLETMLFPIFRQKTHEASTAAAWRASVSRETNGKLSASGLRSEHHAQRASASAQLEMREGAARTV